jgi:hypothetical protein
MSDTLVSRRHIAFAVLCGFAGLALIGWAVPRTPAMQPAPAPEVMPAPPAQPVIDTVPPPTPQPRRPIYAAPMPTPTPASNSTTATPWAPLLDYIWGRESSRGTDPRARPGIIGAAGERGQYQVTPIFVADVKRVSGFAIDPDDNASCKTGIVLWYQFWLSRVPPPKGMHEHWVLYNRGPSGYRDWRKVNP